MAQIKTKGLEDGAVTSAKLALNLDATKIADGTVSNTEFQYLGSVTSDIQTQLNAKIASSVQIGTAANSGLSGGGDLSANRALAVDVNNATAGTVAGTDEILFADVSASNVLRKTTAQDIANLAGAGIQAASQIFTLSNTDVTNGYVTIAQTPLANSVHMKVRGLGALMEGSLYEYEVIGQQVWFRNDLAQPTGAAKLVLGDVVEIKYLY